MKIKSKVDIYHYTDYREFLKDYYNDAKEQDPRFSYEYLRNRIGYRSRAFYYQIINGKTNISPEMALKFAKFLKLNTKQKEYFQLLVLYDQTKDSESRMEYSKRLASFKLPVETKKLYKKHYQLLSSWYYLAVRELLAISQFKGKTDKEFAELGKKLKPSIKPHQVKAAISLLKKLDIIKKNQKGFYKRKDKNLEFPPDMDKNLLLHYIMNTIDLSKKAYLRESKDLRNFDAVTFSVSREGFNRIRQEQNEFLTRILAIANNPKETADRVYQFNCQIFPLAINKNSN